MGLMLEMTQLIRLIPMNLTSTPKRVSTILLCLFMTMLVLCLRTLAQVITLLKAIVY